MEFRIVKRKTGCIEENWWTETLGGVTNYLQLQYRETVIITMRGKKRVNRQWKPVPIVEEK